MREFFRSLKVSPEQGKYFQRWLFAAAVLLFLATLSILGVSKWLAAPSALESGDQLMVLRHYHESTGIARHQAWKPYIIGLLGGLWSAGLIASAVWFYRWSRGRPLPKVLSWILMSAGFTKGPENSLSTENEWTDELEEGLKEFARPTGVKCLLVIGGWGTGKTHRVRGFFQRTEIPEFCCSYISLFGLKDVDAVFEEILSNIEASRNRRWRIGIVLMRVVIWGAALLSKLFSYQALSIAVSRRFVRDMVVVIDDLERCDEELSLRRVFGLLDRLTTRQQCRVVVICDPTKLSDALLQEMAAEADSGEEDDPGDVKKGSLFPPSRELRKRPSCVEFLQYREKVFEAWIEYDPTPEQNARIIFGREDGIAREMFANLRIANIRIMRQAKRLLDRLDPLLGAARPDVRQEVVKHAMALTCLHDVAGDTTGQWAQQSAIGIEVLEQSRKEDDSARSPEAWIIHRSNFSPAVFDEAIIGYLRTGVLKENDFKKGLAEENQKNSADELSRHMRAAWETIWGRFGPSREDAIAAFLGLLEKYDLDMSLINFSSVLDAFEKIGVAINREELLDEWFAKHRDEIDANMIDNLVSFRQGQLPKDIEGRLIHIRDAGEAIPTVASVMQIFERQEGLSEKNINVLASASVEEYEKWFDSTPGSIQIARDVLRSPPQRGDGRQTKIRRRLLVALNHLRKRSEMDAIRVKEYALRK